MINRKTWAGMTSPGLLFTWVFPCQGLFLTSYSFLSWTLVMFNVSQWERHLLWGKMPDAILNTQQHQLSSLLLSELNFSLVILGKGGNTAGEVAPFISRGIIWCNLRIKNLFYIIVKKELPRWNSGKGSPCNAGDAGDTSSDTWVRKIPQEDMATHPTIFAWEIPWTEEPRGLQSMGLQRVRYDWACMK